MVFSLKDIADSSRGVVHKKGSFTQVDPKDVDSPKYKKGDRVLIVDGDVLAFKVSAVCEYVFMYKHKTTLQTKYAKSKKQFKADLQKEIEKQFGECSDEKLEEIYNEYSCEPCKVPEKWNYCEKTLRQAMKKLLSVTNCNKFEIYIGGENNFRLNLPLPTRYKVSRDDGVDKRPFHLKASKDFLVSNYGAVIIKNKEADDVVQMRSFELSNQGIHSVVYTNDKDSKQAYFGEWYNPDTEKAIELNSYLGEIHKEQNKKGCGLFWLLYQINQGDPIDGYSPKVFYSKKNYPRGFGHVAFYNEFAHLTTPNELLSHFCLVMKKLLGEDNVHVYESWDGVEQRLNWLGIVELMYKCAYMQIYREDNTTFQSLCESHGVDVLGVYNERI